MSIRFAQIEPTTRCNFTCGFCAGRSMRQGDLPWETFERFLAQNDALEHVELQGEGEPLMHPRFFDMVARCRERGIRVSLITNGSLLSSHADALIEAGIESLDVSMESALDADFQSIRGGKLAKVKEGLRHLIARRRELGRDRPVVGLTVTVLRRTLGALDGIVALYRELGLDGGVSVQPLQRMHGYTDRYDDAMRAEIVGDDAWRSYLDRCASQLATVRRTSTVRRFYDDLFERWHPDYGTCPWVESGVYVTIDGDVRPCAYQKQPEDTLGRTSNDADDASAMQRKRSLLANTLRSGTLPAPCAGCPTGTLAVAHVQAARRRFAPP